jgi:hypothetical protein
MTSQSESPSTKGGNRERGLLPRQQAMRKGNYSDLGTDEAESTLISNLEARASKTVSGVDGFRAAIPGERAPLGVESLGKAFHEDEKPSDSERRKRPSFKDMAHKVQAMQRVASLRLQASNLLLESRTRQSGHQRAHTLLAQINETEDKDATDVVADFSTDPFGLKTTSMDFQGLDILWDDEGTSEYSRDDGSEIQLSSDLDVSPTDNASSESLPLLSSNGTGQYSAVKERRRLARRNMINRRWESFMDCVHPVKMIQRIVGWISRSSLLVAVPLFVAAWPLFYYFDNPELDFLPGSATLSWWFNFFGEFAFSIL